MNKLRKTFTISVMAITVLSMSMVVVPDVGATASAGDLIKMDGLSSVYYLGADSKRYVFPNESTYFAWYSDFSSVVTIPQSELESYSLGANVVMRPGTKLVKITTDPKVYAVTDNGVLSWVPDEATASALYGADWAARIIDVPDAFFTNYTISATNVSSTAYPQGSLIQLPATADVYYINADGNAQKIANEATMTANRFKYSDVITTAADFTLPTLGTEIAAVDTTIADTSQGGGGATGIDPLAGTGLTVALASDTPAAASIIADNTANEYPQALIPFTKVNFTAASDGDVKITGLSFTREGIASDGDIGNLYLYDGDGIMSRIAEYNSFNSKVVTFSNSAGLFTVSAGTTKSVMLRGDLSRQNPSVTSGKTIGFNLVAASSVTTNGASVSGSFPMAGNLMSTAAVSDLGHLVFSSYTVIPTSVKADQADVTLWTMNVGASSQNIELRYLKFTMVGTISNTDIQNIRLELQGTQVGTAVDQIASDNTVTFDMTDSPMVINSGQTKQLSIRGNMYGGSGRVFKFTVQKSANVVVYDSNYSVYVTPNITNVTTAFSVIQPTTGNGTTVSSGTLTLGVATDSPTGNIPDGASSVTLAKFSLYAAGENVKIESLSASSTATKNTEALVNLKMLLDGTQVGSTVTSLTCDGSSSASFTFGSTFVIPAGETKYLTLVADTTNSLFVATDTVVVALETGANNAVGQTTLTAISTTAQNGRTLTLAAGTATVAENTSFGDRNSDNPSGTVSASDTQIASFIITAGSGEAIDVSQIVLQDFSLTTQMGDNFQNLKIKNAGVQIGSTISSLDSSGTQATYTFSPPTSIRVSAGQQYVVDVFADIKSSVANSAINLVEVINYYSLTATGVTTGTTASDANAIGLQQAYISAQGNLTITRDTNSALAQQLVLGTTDVELVKFKFQADAAEAIDISKIVLNDLINTGTGTIKNVRIYDGDTPVGQAIDLSTEYASTTYGAFAGISLEIPKNGSKIITVKADIATYTDIAANSPSGSTHEVSIYPLYDGSSESITAVGASSGQSITGGYLDIGTTPDAEQRGNQMTVYKTKITIAWHADTPAGSYTGAANQPVAYINITNSSNVGNYSASIKTMNFAIGRVGASLTADRSLNVYKDSAVVANLLANTSWLGSVAEQFGDTKITTFVDTEIAAGGTRLFIVTLDTQDAGLTSGTTDKISISLASDDVVWMDGASGDAGTTSLITSVNTLPLSTKTMSY